MIEENGDSNLSMENQEFWKYEIFFTIGVMLEIESIL